ncbi:hypothetical protein J7E70_30255 [Variovorax paradoxus]|nr:hypothetical protein [Variovorax paradoxus]MBT2304705.1 hypothetical protein [Variovorax paradoxus]
MSTATSERRKLQRIRAAIKARGLRVEQIGTGAAVRVRGPGVHVIAASLSDLSEHDLAPATQQDEQPNIL